LTRAAVTADIRSVTAPGAAGLDASRALEESERRYRLIAENTHDLVALVDEEGRLAYVSPSSERILGIRPDELVGTPALDRVRPEDRAAAQVMLTRARAGERLLSTFLTPRADGTFSYLETQVHTIESGGARHILCVSRDVTEWKDAERELLASLAEKDALLRELHHRMKNNLQLVSSLLSLQADKNRDPAFGALVQASKNRLRAMAMVHESLNRGLHFTTVDLAASLKELCGHLVRAHGAERIAIHTEVENLPLNLDRTVPFVLIVNELVSNCLEHAFPPEREGRIDVELGVRADGRYVLSVADDGVGLPEDVDPAHPRTLGLSLVCDLTAQLRGEIEVVARRPAKIAITFDPHPSAQGHT
jgi:two-component system, sensor histidine kinase PdtaS